MPSDTSTCPQGGPQPGSELCEVTEQAIKENIEAHLLLNIKGNEMEPLK